MESHQPYPLEGLLYIREIHRNDLAHSSSVARTFGNIPPSQWNPFGVVYTIWDDNGPIKLPNGATLTTKSRGLVEVLVADFEVRTELDTNSVNLYSVHATVQVNGAKIDGLGKEDVRQDLKYDKCFQYSHPPEQMDKYTRLGAMRTFFSEHAIETFTLDTNDYLDHETGEFDAAGYNHSLTPAFDRLLDATYNEFRTLSTEEKVVAINLAIVSGNCFLYGILVVLGRCSMLEFFRASMAANQMVAEVYGDVTREDYIEAFESQKGVFLALRDYLEEAKIQEEQELNDELKYQSWYRLMPPDSQNCIRYAVRHLARKDLDDYAAVVLNIGKAIEIAIKELIFKPFKDVQFYQNPQIELVDNRGKARVLGTFVQKEEFSLAFGQMVFILGLKGGNTEKKEPLLQEFFNHCRRVEVMPGIAESALLKRIEGVVEVRNKAAHDTLFPDYMVVDALFKEVKSLLTDLFQN